MRKSLVVLACFAVACGPPPPIIHPSSPLELDLNLPGGCAGAAAPAFPGAIKTLDIKVYDKKWTGVFQTPRPAPAFEQQCPVAGGTFTCKLNWPQDRTLVANGEPVTVEVDGYDGPAIATAKLLARGISPTVMTAPLGKPPAHVPVLLAAVGSTPSCPATDLHTPRSHHTASLLCDGRVLVVGGISLSSQLAGAPAPITTGAFEIYDPGTGTWSNTGLPAFSAQDARYDHVASPLCKTNPTTGALTSQVFIAGGTDAAGNSLSSVLVWSSDPGSSGTYTTFQNMLQAKRSHASALKWTETQVLVVGGEDLASGPQLTYELYNVSGQISVKLTPFATTTARLQPALAANPVNGSLVMCGGQGASDTVAPCEQLLPQLLASGAAEPFLRGPGTLMFGVNLPTPEMLIFGGIASNAPSGVESVERLSPNYAFNPGAGNMTRARNFAAGAQLPGDKILLVGGQVEPPDRGFETPDAAMEVYDPSAGMGNGASMMFGNMQAARSRFTATTLNDGSVLVVGGNAQMNQPGSEIIAVP